MQANHLLKVKLQLPVSHTIRYALHSVGMCRIELLECTQAAFTATQRLFGPVFLHDDERSGVEGRLLSLHSSSVREFVVMLLLFVNNGDWFQSSEKRMFVHAFSWNYEMFVLLAVSLCRKTCCMLCMLQDTFHITIWTCLVHTSSQRVALVCAIGHLSV
jgi:hypothetical protein